MRPKFEGCKQPRSKGGLGRSTGLLGVILRTRTIGMLYIHRGCSIDKGKACSVDVFELNAGDAMMGKQI